VVLRAQGTYTCIGLKNNQMHVVPGATVTLYEADGVTLLGAPRYSLPVGGVQITQNPVTSNQNGAITPFWLDVPQYITVKWTASGFAGATDVISVGTPQTPAPGAHAHAEGDITNLGADLAAKANLLHGHPAADIISGIIAAIRLGSGTPSSNTFLRGDSLWTVVPGGAFSALSDTNIVNPAKYHEPVFDGSKWFNILHRYRPVGAVADGNTDDSAAFSSMFGDIAAAGRGFIELRNKPYAIKNQEIPPNVVFDLNGAALQFPSAGVVSGDDILRSKNFTALTGTAGTTNSASPAPYGFSVINGTIDTVAGRGGRHALALFAMGYTLENLKLIEQGGGCCLWEEYGNNSEDWITGSAYQKGDTSFFHRMLTLIDSGAAAVNAPASNNMSLAITGVTNAINPTINTQRPHFMSAGMTGVVISGVLGATGVNGTWTITSVPSSTSFTITTGAPGAYTSGGTVAYPVSAAWACLGPHDSYNDQIIVIAAGGVQNARRGVLLGSGTGGGSATGTIFTNTHIYNNFDVGLDARNGGMMFTGCQVEGSRKCVALFRENGRITFIGGRIFGGFGGVTLLSIRDCNHNTIIAQMQQAGSGNAPAAGFNNTYIETYSVSDSELSLMMNHDYNTNAKAASGNVPTHGFGRAYMDAYGISSAVLSADWGTLVDATHWGWDMTPSGVVITTG
jgi:hypothetical protein